MVTSFSVIIHTVYAKRYEIERLKEMKIKTLLLGCLVLVLSACNSTGNNQANNHPIPDNSKAYAYEGVNIPSPQEATIYDYMFYAAKQADKMKFKKFSLFREITKDKYDNFKLNRISTFMFNEDDDLNKVKRYEKPYRKLELIGTFETNEYKDKRYFPLGFVPGAA